MARLRVLETVYGHLDKIAIRHWKRRLVIEMTKVTLEHLELCADLALSKRSLFSGLFTRPRELCAQL